MTMSIGIRLSIIIIVKVIICKIIKFNPLNDKKDLLLVSVHCIDVTSTIQTQTLLYQLLKLLKQSLTGHAIS